MIPTFPDPVGAPSPPGLGRLRALVGAPRSRRRSQTLPLAGRLALVWKAMTWSQRLLFLGIPGTQGELTNKNEGSGGVNHLIN